MYIRDLLLITLLNVSVILTLIIYIKVIHPSDSVRNIGVLRKVIYMLVFI